MKVSEKGAVSIYGMGRFPVTLYKEQWLKLLDMAADIRAFIAANEAQLKRKRRLDDIGFPIDAGGFSGACGKHHLQQRLQYLLQSFAAVLAGGLRIEAGYVAAAARSTLKFHGSS
jgi:hypothetical protein